MANKPMKRCSTLFIRSLQIKTTVRFHYTAIRMTDIQNSGNANYWQECEVRNFIVGGNAKME